jgi:hypothetical protein
MVFGENKHKKTAVLSNNHFELGEGKYNIPFSCRLTLIITAVPVLVLGFYIPQSLHNLLTQAAAILAK